MSKALRLFSIVIFTFAVVAALFTKSYGQRVDVKIELDTVGRAKVTGKFEAPDLPKNPRSFAFERTVAGSDTGSKRVSELELLDREGRLVEFRKLMEGEFLADRDVTAWRYTIDLAPLKERSAAAHNSWIQDGRGIVMGRDLLPLGARAGRVVINAPGMEPVALNGDDIREKVVPFGGWVQTQIGSVPLQLFINGEWLFTQEEAVTMVSEIYRSYRDLFKHDSRPGQLLLSKFPIQTRPGQWEAETIGSTIIIISSDMPFKTPSLQRLHEQLRHELFHLWIPNGVNLTGNYDWFYEGFALYRSLKLAVELNRIRFEDFLDTLSRAHTLDSAYTQRTSLIQASVNRFSGSNTQVYARGMLVAFLSDIELLRGSKGKRSIENVLRDVFEKHRKPAEPVDGNTAVLGLLRSHPELIPVIERYITGGQGIDWTANLAAAGIEDTANGPVTVLRVKEKLSGREKTLLDKLGYNNWRKLSPNSK